MKPSRYLASDSNETLELSNDGRTSPLYSTVRNSFMHFHDSDAEIPDWLSVPRRSKSAPSLRREAEKETDAQSDFAWVWPKSSRLPCLMPIAAPAHLVLRDKGPESQLDAASHSAISIHDSLVCRPKPQPETMLVRSAGKSCWANSDDLMSQEDMSVYDQEFEIGEQALTFDSESNCYTVMIRNIPCGCSREDVLQAIDSVGFNGLYDFFYLPRRRYKTMGYGFIGFPDPHLTRSFAESMTGYRFPTRNSKKVVSVVPARIQGLNSCLDHFKSTRAMHSKQSQVFFARAEA
jgi:hypothetical protein